MPKSLISAGAARFAHLLGRGPASETLLAATAEADDEEMKQREGENDDDYAKRKADKKAADDKKKPQDEDEDDDEEMKAAARAEGVTAERARCAAIFAAPAAAANVALAASLAFETDLTAEQAVGILAKTPAPRGRLADRMADAGLPRIAPGAPPRPAGPAAAAASWDAAMADLKPKG